MKSKKYIQKVVGFFSSTARVIGSILVGIISILSFFIFVKNNSKKREEEVFDEIDKAKRDNDFQDGKIDYVNEKIEDIGKKQEELIDELDDAIVDDSKDLEDFFDKRGF